MGTYYPNSISDGSSSGSAVAAALGLCTAALGTEVPEDAALPYSAATDAAVRQWEAS